MDVHDLLVQAKPFAARVEDMLGRLEMLDVCRNLQMDHICVRLDDAFLTQKIHTHLLFVSHCISTAMVAGRRIHIFQLYEPLQVGSWFTHGVELPHPKRGQAYENGWEHVEFVLPNTKNSMAALRVNFESQFPQLSKTSLLESYQRKDSEPYSGDDQLANPTIAIKSAGVTAKFHPRSIQKVVGYQ